MNPKPPPHPGTAAAATPQRPPGRDTDSSQALPVGHRLHEFTLETLLHAGSESLLYRAHDNLSPRSVVIKEYMPAHWAHRLPDQSVAPRARRHAEAFALGLHRFVSDAKTLASLDHPSLQKVIRCWEGNGSAYAVMPLYQGQTLHDWLLAHEEPVPERWLKELLRPLLDALRVLHGGGRLHLAIAPENILLLAGHRPVLMGFGARPADAGAPALSLRPGYAPIEQYAESAVDKPGAWTDLYALCAVLHTAILGHAPEPSVARQIKDAQPPIAQAAAGRYSDAFLRAIDAGLAVRPADRPQDVAALRARFFPEMFVLTEPAELDAPAVAATAASRPAPPVREKPSAPAAQNDKPAARPGVAVVPVVPRAAAAAAAVRPARRHAAASRRGLLTALACALVAAAAWWLASSPGVLGLLEPVRTYLAGVLAPPPPREPFGVLAALQRAVQQADPAFAVSAQPGKTPLVIGRDRLRFHVQSSQGGYLYLFLTGADAAHLWLLFPNQADNNNRLEAGRDTVIPRAGWHITASGPPGLDHIVALVTRYPMDLDSLGLRRDGDVHELDQAMAARRWAEQPEPGSPLVGPPLCPPGTPLPCQQRFGAVLMQIEEVTAADARE